MLLLRVELDLDNYVFTVFTIAPWWWVNTLHKWYGKGGGDSRVFHLFYVSGSYQALYSCQLVIYTLFFKDYLHLLQSAHTRNTFKAKKEKKQNSALTPWFKEPVVVIQGRDRRNRRQRDSL